MEGAVEPSLTPRAIATGCLLGVLLAAGNVYAGLKLGYLDGGGITAAVVSFAMFSALRTRPFSVSENNLTQTLASSAAMMAMTAGIVGPIPALAMMGKRYPSWAVMAWAVALGAVGIAIARVLREPLIEREQLAFPTGRATGEVIAAMHAARESALGRARSLFIALLLAAAFTWFRDGRPALLPQAVFLPWGSSGLIQAGLWLGVSMSPMLLASGMLVGPRAGLSMLGGSTLAWGILAPAMLALKWVAKPDYAELLSRLLWPGVSLLVSSALTGFLLEWRSVRRALGDLARLRAPGAPRDATSRSWRLLLWASIVVIVSIGWRVFGVNPALTLAVLVFSVVLATVSARAAGETDIAPAGPAGAITQIVFGAPSLVTSLISGGVVSATSTQTAQMMWAFKSGQRLHTNPAHQTWCQLIGVVVGALVVVPAYDLVQRAYGLGTPLMPAPSALSWKATAEAVQLGAAAMSREAALAAGLAFAAGVGLTLLGRTAAAKYLPSPVAIGIAFVIPAPLSGALFVGSVLLALFERYAPDWAREHVPSLAAGAIAGESLTGIVIAGLLASGVFG